MSRFLVALGAFALSAVVIVVVAQSQGPSSTSPRSPVVTMQANVGGAGMMGTRAVAARDVSIGILHVQRGCHVWRNGTKTGPTIRLTMQRGGRLSIVNQDVDAHQLMQISGPRLHMPGPMRMMGGARLRFMKPGVYRLATRTVELPGAGMTDVLTIGPDNHLRLTVTVT